MTVDVLGVGFGPSGIALAGAIEDRAEAAGRRPFGSVLFLEKAQDSAWHRDMLLRETDIQHHFLRDLATPRDPRSRFTFANYLHEKGRLYEFGELMLGAAGGAVSRLEWSDYLTWAADQLGDYVRYGAEVLAVRPAGSDHVVAETTDGTVTARSLVVCSGRHPVVPPEFDHLLGPTVFHSSQFRRALDGLDGSRPLRFAVVGSGESAVEVLTHLHSAFLDSRLVSIHRTIGFKHVDLSQFSNRIFHPDHVDRFHALGAEQRQAVRREARPTNFGVVDAQAADILYRKLYEDMVTGVSRADLRTSCRITGASTDGDVHRIGLQDVHTGARCEVEADVVVLCTGYREDLFPADVEPLADLLELDEEGGPHVDRDYRVATAAGFDVPIYLSGTTERTHGPSDSASFSMVAIRAATILDSLLAALSGPGRAPRPGSPSQPAG